MKNNKNLLKLNKIVAVVHKHLIDSINTCHFRLINFVRDHYFDYLFLFENILNLLHLASTFFYHFSIRLYVIFLLDLQIHLHHVVYRFSIDLYSICHQDKYKYHTRLFYHQRNYLHINDHLATCIDLIHAYYFCANILHKLDHPPNNIYHIR